MNELENFHVDELMNLYACESCGSKEFNNATCAYCGNKNEKLEAKVQELVSLLKNYTYFKLTPTLISLYAISNLVSIEELTTFLTQHKIKEEIEKQKEELAEKIRKQEKLCLEEEIVGISLLKNHLMPDFPVNLTIKNILLGEKLVSLDFFHEVIKLFVENAMSSIANNRLPEYKPTCEIKEMKNLGGARNTSNIYLSSDTVKNIYQGNLHNLQTIFHELTHIKQNINIALGVIDSRTIRYIKETVINAICQEQNIDFYHLEYQKLSMEIDANLEGWVYLRRYLEYLGVMEKTKETSIEEIMHELERKTNYKVNVADYDFLEQEELDFEELFLICINKKPEYFDLYPPLKLLYIRDNDTIRAKTKEELMDSIKSIQDINTIRYLMDAIIKKEKEDLIRS